jgi:hypothetical protein
VFVRASGSVLPVASLARFRGHVRVQGNRPRASRLRASGVRAVQEQCAGDAIRRGDPVEGYTGVPIVFLQHMRVSSGGLAHEQEDPEVRGEVGLANQSGSIVSSHGPRHPTILTPRGSLNRYHHESPRRLLLRPSSTHDNPSRQTSSSPTEPRHHRAILINNPVHRGNLLSAHSSSLPRLPQGLP